MALDYPAKIILAWSESVKGNKKITDWLIKNGYPELGIFHFAVRNDLKAKKWLSDHKFHFLLALINGAEGNEKAISFLKKNHQDLLLNMALAADNDIDSLKWLKLNSSPQIVILTMNLMHIKNKIEERNKDIHHIQF